MGFVIRWGLVGSFKNGAREKFFVKLKLNDLKRSEAKTHPTPLYYYLKEKKSLREALIAKF